MYSINEIKDYSRRIAEAFNPERIILFGSFAKNRAKEDSDVDLLVIMNYNGRGVEQSFHIRRVVSPRFPLDMIVRKPEEVSDRLKKGDYFLREIMDEGIVLYERAG
ncbi:MAG: nucleotidyltransferase domain-containing protein [Bacteroidetes bacterium]|nr:nucleotidyltransferase domain-containing protein [Bacteroidota bacterium]MCL5738636.1 nucleotidyltransferase domain-containing protein [Bacteroidota bacterium]